MTHDELIAELVKADGAILYWQLPKEAVEAVVASGMAHINDDDCLVHRDATRIDKGAYTLRVE